MTREAIRKSLMQLKKEYGVLAIKAEFEAEGSRKDELIMLREMVESADLGMIIKIGGCEAVHDLDQCKLLAATGVMAPMIETPFALKKFKGAVDKIYGDEKEIERIINAETYTCLTNFDGILEQGRGFLTGVTVGRSDLSASMGILKDNIEGEDVFEATKAFCIASKSAGLITNFGGNIGIESIPFIVRMNPWIDRFETRKVVIPKSDDGNYLRDVILAALEFELTYLRFKSNYYSSMAHEDGSRMDRINKQLKTYKGENK